MSSTEAVVRTKALYLSRDDVTKMLAGRCPKSVMEKLRILQAQFRDEIPPNWREQASAFVAAQGGKVNVMSTQAAAGVKKPRASGKSGIADKLEAARLAEEALADFDLDSIDLEGLI